jgi:hypothetical protein
MAGAIRPCTVARYSNLTFRKADGQNSPVEPLATRHSGTVAMKQIRAYPLESEADLARIALEGADIPAIVVRVGIGMKGRVLLVGPPITVLLLNQGLSLAAYAATAIMSLSVNFDTSCCIGSVAGPRRLPSWKSSNSFTI